MAKDCCHGYMHHLLGSQSHTSVMWKPGALLRRDIETGGDVEDIYILMVKVFR